MARLKAADIAGYAHGAGFRGSDRVTAVAVALAESGGDTQAHNSTPPDDSYGLWQINMLGDMGPDRRRRLGIDANSALFDPIVNAQAAKMIHAGSGWKAWTTYTSGAYSQYRMEAEQGVNAYLSNLVGQVNDLADAANMGINPLGEVVGDPAAAIADATRYIAAAGTWLGNRDNWVRILQVVVGAGAVLGGLVLVARPLITNAAGGVVGGVVKGVVKGIKKK